MIRSPGAQGISYTTLMGPLARFFQTEAARMTVEEFVAAQVTSYFYLNPVEDDIASSVEAYYLANPPADGRAPTHEEIQQAVDAYIEQYGTVDASDLAAAVSAYLKANPPKDGAQGPAGQNATPEMVAAGVQSYFSANPLAPLVATQVQTYFMANPQPVPAINPGQADTASGTTGTSARYAREDHSHPLPAIPPAAVPATNAALPLAATAAVGASTRYAREDHIHPLPPGSTKDAKTDIVTTSTSGNLAMWSKTYPAGFWSAKPVFVIEVQINSPMILHSIGISGSVATGFVVAAYFYRLNTGVTVSILGTTASLLNTPGTITFSYRASEPV